MIAESEIIVPNGFKFLGKTVGIKESQKKDFALVVLNKPVPAAAVFTQNQFCGECIPIGRETIKQNELQAVFVNSGIANVATGEEGRNNVLKTIEALSNDLGIDSSRILMSSTGKIGPQLPIDKIVSGIDNLESELSESKNAAEDFANAILTTDKRIKIRSLQLKSKTNETVTILGVAKGAGMIEPNMATMLSYIFTDAIIPKNEIQNVLTNAVNQSFNAISVDTDTSTSDTVALLASGISGEVNSFDFQNALNLVTLELAKDIIRDAEGATKLIKVEVLNADSGLDAKRFAKSIVNSPLLKCAVYGNDPNWGRIAMALGKTFNAKFNKSNLLIKFGEYIIFEDGKENVEFRKSISEYLENNSEIVITVDLKLKNSNFIAYGCDLTEEYVHINADYTT